MKSAVMPPSLDSKLVERLVNLADNIVIHIEKGFDPDELIAEFNNLAKCGYTHEEFATFPEATTTKNFVEITLTPKPVKDDDITDQDLLQLIEWIKEAKGSEREQNYWLMILDRNLPHPEISGLIYWPSEHGLPDKLTAEEILAEAKAYKVIQL